MFYGLQRDAECKASFKEDASDSPTCSAVALALRAEQPEDQSQSPLPSLPSRRAPGQRPLPPARPLQKPRGAACHTCSHLVSGPLLLAHDEVLHEATQGAHGRRHLLQRGGGSHDASQKLWEGSRCCHETSRSAHAPPQPIVGRRPRGGRTAPRSRACRF